MIKKLRNSQYFTIVNDMAGYVRRSSQQAAAAQYKRSSIKKNERWKVILKVGPGGIIQRYPKAALKLDVIGCLCSNVRRLPSFLLSMVVSSDLA